MTKADTPRRTAGTGTPRGKGTYVPQACSVCRQKKCKCDGTRPVCTACVVDGRQDECSWTGEPARGPRTEAHFEAMRRRAEALREYANLLESMLEKCRRDHGGAWDDGQSYLQFRPLDADGIHVPEEMDVVDEEEDPVGDGVSVQSLCLPTQNLKLVEGDFLLHRNTAIFRFAPEATLPASASRFPAMVEDPEASYILLVDDVDASYYNPDFDWSRHLPTIVPLDRKTHDRLLDLLFRFFTSWCLRVVPALFLRDMGRALRGPRSQTPPKTHHYSPMLHNALIALASAFSDDPRIRDRKAREYFAAEAKKLIETECQKPSISVVQALSILGSYHSSQGEQTLGYLYFGMSARIGQALGLGTDCSTWVQAGLISEHDRLDRNWTYWTMLTQDVCWSLYVGRDFCIQPPPEGQTIPIPFVDADFDQVPWFHPEANIPPQPNYLSKTFAASCQLLMIARRIMNVVNDLNNRSTRHEITEELISMIDLELHNWKGNLAPEVDITLKTRPTATSHRLMLHLGYWWLFILLHRPFYHRKARSGYGSEKDIDHVKLCKRAAENIMELLGTYKSLYTLRYTSITQVQTVFSAGTVFLLMAVQAMNGSRVAQVTLENSLAQANLCIQYLFEIGKSWQCATNIGDILKNLVQAQLQPLFERRSITITSPSAGPRDNRPLGASRFSGKSRSTPQARRSSRQRRAIGHLVTHATNQSNNVTPPPSQAVQSDLPPPITPIDEESSSETPVTAETLPVLGSWILNPAGSGSDLSGLLGMLEGDALPDTPFIPLFSADDPENLTDEFLRYQFGSFVTESQYPSIPTQESDLSFLEQFWDEHFGTA